MDGKQPSKRRRLAAAEMEDELYRTTHHSERSRVQSPPLTAPFTEPALISTLPIDNRGLGSLPAQSAPPSEGVVAPVQGAPTSAPSFDGPSTADLRGVYPEEYEHGERYGRRLATRYNSSLVDDEQAASRAEWLYQGQTQASRMATYGGGYGQPFPSPRGGGLGASFEGQERES
jgi:hypothetical protein